MKEELLDQLIGQQAANATLLYAMARLITASSPEARQALQLKVEAAALTEKQTLSGSQRQAYDEHLSGLRRLWA